MTHPPWISDESVLARWMSMEIGKINEVIVRDRKPSPCCSMKKISVQPQKMANRIFFDKGVIAVLGGGLPAELYSRFRLPMLFFMSPEVPGSCWCADVPPLKS